MPRYAVLAAFFGAILALPTMARAHDSPAYSHDSNVKTHQPDWMSGLRDATTLQQLSLPGTHDTMSRYGGDAVATQSLSLPDQLESGIRVLDIRCRHIKDIFAIHHGAFFQNVFFGDVLNMARTFLRAHPRETIYMRVKEEYDPSENTRTFEETFRNYYWKDWSDIFWQGTDDNPTLGATRGKVVVLQNFSAGQKYGVNYDSFSTQDEYSLGTNWDLYRKWEDVRGQLEKANGNRSQKSLNYLSGSGGSFPYFVASGHSNPATGAPRLATGRTTPAFKDSWPDFPRVDCFIGICTIAFEGTNVLTYHRLESFGYVGLIMADFPGPGLIERVISRNNGLK